MAHHDDETFEGSHAADATDGKAIVYVRSVNAGELPEEMREKLLAGKPNAAERQPALYAVADGEGRMIGLFPSRDAAFTAARYHDLAPVSAH